MPDFRLNFERKGAGEPTIVFVPGFMCELKDWRHQVAHFQQTNETIALEHRGVGGSPLGDEPLTVERLGQDVADLLEQEDITNAVVVGHSMGCRLALEACLRAPERVAGLVVIDSSRTFGEYEQALANYDKMVAERGLYGFINLTFSMMFFESIPGWGAEIIERVASTPESIGVPLQRDIYHHDANRLPTALSELTVPMLIIQATARAERGGIRPIAEGETTLWQALADKVAVDYEIFRIIGPGHFVMIEDPDAVNAHIERFIAERVTQKA